jgi:hypothetical protein
MLNRKTIAHKKPLTCKKPLKGAKPVPGPTITIGTEGSAGNLKLDCLTKTGAQLQSLLSSEGTELCPDFPIPSV